MAELVVIGPVHPWHPVITNAVTGARFMGTLRLCDLPECSSRYRHRGKHAIEGPDWHHEPRAWQPAPSDGRRSTASGRGSRNHRHATPTAHNPAAAIRAEPVSGLVR